jgi:predicted RNA-binding Zn ribbon-like protein
MNMLTAYFDQGARTAVELANARSRFRRGVAVDPDPTTPATLQSLQTALRAILNADSPAAAAAGINALLHAAAAAPVLEADAEGRWRLHLHSPHADALSRCTVKTATGLAALLDDDAWDAVKPCAAERCDDFFLDRSRNGSAKYCSRTCANRVNARLHRRRR